MLGKVCRQFFLAALLRIEGGPQIGQFLFQLLPVSHARGKGRITLRDLLLEQSGYAAQRSCECLAGAGQRQQRGIPFGEPCHGLLPAAHLRCENGIPLRERRRQLLFRTQSRGEFGTLRRQCRGRLLRVPVCAAVEFRSAIFCSSAAMARVFWIKVALFAARMGW